MSEIKKNTLIVNYLPQTLKDEEFETIFADIGTIRTCKIVRDRNSGYSFGFGFVEYIDDNDASRAIEVLNGLQLQNKVIKVAYSRQGEKVKGANLHVRNLPMSCTVKDLENIFGVYGTIIQSRILTSHETGLSKGVGFVLFNSRDQAHTALKALNGAVLPGSSTALHVSFAEDKNKPSPKFQQKFLSYSAAVSEGHSDIESLIGGYNISVAAGLTRRASGLHVARGRGVMRGRGRGGPVRNQTSLAQLRYNPITSVAGYGLSSIPVVAASSSSGQGYIIYAYNIGSKTTQEELSDLFSLYGIVSKVDVIWDYQKNSGKGYGFITMPNYEQAAHAIQCLNGYNYAGKPLQVSFKTPKA